MNSSVSGISMQINLNQSQRFFSIFYITWHQTTYILKRPREQHCVPYHYMS